jgi:hypothetical protein
VLIDVEVGGQRSQEMHVDGGAIAQTFLIPLQIGVLTNFRQANLAGDHHAYMRKTAPRPIQFLARTREERRMPRAM